MAASRRADAAGAYLISPLNAGILSGRGLGCCGGGLCSSTFSAALKRPVIVFRQLEAKLISLMAVLAVQEIKQLRQAQEQRD